MYNDNCIDNNITCVVLLCLYILTYISITGTQLSTGVLIGQLCSCHGAGDMNEGDRSANKVLMDTCTLPSVDEDGEIAIEVSDSQ